MKKRSLRTLIRFGQRLALTPERCSTGKVVHVKLFCKFDLGESSDLVWTRSEALAGRSVLSIEKPFQTQTRMQDVRQPSKGIMATIQLQDLWSATVVLQAG